MAKHNFQIRLIEGKSLMTPWGYRFRADRPVVTADERLVAYAKANPTRLACLDAGGIRSEEVLRARRTTLARRRPGAPLDGGGDAMPAPRPEPVFVPEQTEATAPDDDDDDDDDDEITATPAPVVTTPKKKAKVKASSKKPAKKKA